MAILDRALLFYAPLVDTGPDKSLTLLITPFLTPSVADNELAKFLCFPKFRVSGPGTLFQSNPQW